MPNYDFKCNNDNCNNNEITTISMKMSEYTDEHYCPICNEKLTRTIDSLVCGYMDDKDFYGKTSK